MKFLVGLFKIAFVVVFGFFVMALVVNFLTATFPTWDPGMVTLGALFGYFTGTVDYVSKVVKGEV